eukprot:Hpha_TRINITY_DN16747_c3_g5::TRINITY_DN16747_c3_g5_i1::g.76051::m.76051
MKWVDNWLKKYQKDKLGVEADVDKDYTYSVKAEERDPAKKDGVWVVKLTEGKVKDVAFGITFEMKKDTADGQWMGNCIEWNTNQKDMREGKRADWLRVADSGTTVVE